MNYDNPILIEHLASAYVLGTLNELPRRRIERLAREPDRRAIQEAIWRWERHLNPLTDSAPAIQPSSAVWDAIASRIQGQRAKPATGLWMWRGLTAALTVALVFLLFPIMQEPTAPPREQVAFIEGVDDQPLWVISLNMEDGLLRSRAINTPAREADRVFELWMLPADGPPQSLGLLPVSGGARVAHQVSPVLLALLQGSKGLAVSIEPTGGSPTGLPTGPVVYTAAILEL